MPPPFVDFAATFSGDDFVSLYKSALNNDEQFLAFISSRAITRPIVFAFTSANSPSSISIQVSQGRAEVSILDRFQASFTLSAPAEDWARYFKQNPDPQYQSFWALFRYNLNATRVQVLGDKLSFAQHAHIWRRALDVLHDVQCGTVPTEADEETGDEDHVVGRYIYVEVEQFGRCKISVESSVLEAEGAARKQILFLHTAGGDSRQYHGVMNRRDLRTKYDMYAFDLPSHGRSFPAPKMPPGAYTLTEDAYIGCIAAVIKKLSLNRPIVCGASMAGQVCLAVAISNKLVNSGGAIPVEA